MYDLRRGDAWHVLPNMEADSVDAVVTDPPYGLGFMGKSWDRVDTPFRADFWREVMRVLKPGGHALVFGGSRTFHRTAVALEDAGFEYRDTITWHFGSGFPKNHDISKAIDKAAGAEREVVGDKLDQPGYHLSPGGGDKFGNGKGLHGHRSDARLRAAQVTAPATDAAREWEGWGTALKPACEFVALVRKPLSERNVAANVVAHGTGAVNVDGCRVATDENTARRNKAEMGYHGGNLASDYRTGGAAGRYPASVIHDGSDEVHGAFAAFGRGTGTAARFFYSAKANKRDRDCGERGKTQHPTVKPVSLMAYLVRLITPPGGTVLDPFAGSGVTGEAAVREGMHSILIEREPEYAADIEGRMVRVRDEFGLLAAAAE